MTANQVSIHRCTDKENVNIYTYKADFLLSKPPEKHHIYIHTHIKWNTSKVHLLSHVQLFLTP